MTVPSTTSRDQQTGNGSTTAFTVPFRILAQTHVRVLVTVAGVTTEKTLTTDYTVSGVGGSQHVVTFLVAPVNLALITFLRSVPLTQETDYVPNDPFPAESHEQALDKLTMITQQLDEGQDRALTLPEQVSGVSTELPTPAARNLIGWNALASALQNYTFAEIATLIAYSNKLYETFTGTGAQTAFTLAQDPGSLGNLEISIDGVVQVPGADFTYAGTTLTFIAAPANGAIILVRYDAGLPIGTSAASSVTYASFGASTRTVEDELDDLFVSVKRYGARGDGVTDDTVAINAAIAAVGVAGGGTVYFPPGTYMVKFQGSSLLGADLEIAITVQYNKVQLLGAGKGSTTIKQISGAIRAHVVKMGTRVGTLNPVTDCSVRHMTIDGNNTTLTSPNPSPDEKNGDCINVSTGAERVVIENCRLINAGHYGVGMQRNNFRDCHIRDCEIEDSNGDGIDWKIDTNSGSRNNTIENVKVLRFGLNTALSSQAGIDARQGVNVINCYVGEYADNEAGIRVQVGASDLITTVSVQRSSVVGCTTIATGAGTSSIGFQASVNGAKFANCHAANAKWNWRVRSSLCSFVDCSAVGGEIGWHVFGDANGTPEDNLLANIHSRSGSVGGVVMDQSGGFPPANNSFTNVHAEGNNADTANFTLAATITGTRIIGGQINGGLVDSGTDTMVVAVQGIMGEFRAGRTTTQYVRLHGDASGNYITGVSVAGTPKNLQLISDANSGDLQLLVQAYAGGSRVRFGTLTANADAPITGYIEIKDDGGTLRKLAVIA